MKNDLKISDLNFKRSGYTEKTAIGNGFKQLTGIELKELIINQEVNGNYPGGFTFVARIYENGTIEGINNLGHYDVGYWTIDFNKNTIQLEWENGWYNTTTRVYKVTSTIEFFDIDTGNWRSTFKKFTHLEE